MIGCSDMAGEPTPIPPQRETESGKSADSLAAGRRPDGGMVPRFRDGRVFFKLQIPLGGHMIEKRHHQPSREDDRRSTDKMAEFHRLLRKCLLFPWRFLRPIREKSNLKYQDFVRPAPSGIRRAGSAGAA